LLIRGLNCSFKHARIIDLLGPLGPIRALINTLVSTTNLLSMKEWWHICHHGSIIDQVGAILLAAAWPNTSPAQTTAVCGKRELSAVGKHNLHG
ncbi:MAG: hypothetical protein OIF38_02785, partial [Cellvibrionaceae bacterium]|nr:hypothetical protein [Cellvibrionaceae bacterium]